MPQQSILNFMPAAPFKSLKKTLIQVSVTFFSMTFDYSLLTVLEPKSAPRLGDQARRRGWFPVVAAGMRGCAVRAVGWGWGEDAGREEVLVPVQLQRACVWKLGFMFFIV